MNIWKDVTGYEGLYKINEYGDVYSIPRTIQCGRAHRTVGGMLLKPQIDISGYKTVTLSNGNGDRRPKKVHRLVAMAFIENLQNLPCVNHKDENKENNYFGNLEWCSIEYNNNYGTHQRRSALSRINHTKTSKPVICVETQEIYPSMREAERQTGINQSQIWHCIKEPWRTAKGTHWKIQEGGDYNS